MEFKILETTKGKKCLCFDELFFRFDQTLKNTDLSWRCTDNKCNARIKTDDGLTTMRASKQILSQKNKHSHSLDERKVELRQLRVSAKRKVIDDLSQRPSKIVRTSIKDVGESVLHPNDLKSVSKAIYRVRRKSQPNMPKSREDVHTVLENYPVVTNKSETFLQVNDAENGIVIST